MQLEERSLSKEPNNPEQPEVDLDEDGKPYPNGIEENYMSEERDSGMRKNDSGYDKRDRYEEGSARGRDDRSDRDDYYKDQRSGSRSRSNRNSEKYDKESAGKRTPRSISDQGDDDRRRQVGSPGEYKRRDRFDDSPRYNNAAGAQQEPAEDFTQLYVNGLSRSVRYDSLSALFSGCGEVSDI